MPTIIHRRDLPGLHVTGPEPSPDQALFEGSVTWLALRDGLALHSADYRELEDFDTESVSSERLGFILFLQGGADVAFDERRLRLGATHENDGASYPAGVLISQSRPTTFHRHAQAGARVRKVVVNLAPQWFEAGGLDGYEEYREIERFRREHLGIRHWRPSARLIGLAEQILQPPRYTPMLHHLYLESRALEMAAEALGVLARPAHPLATSLRSRDSLRMQRLRDFLDSGLADNCSLADIARQAGLNPNTLQRQFQALTGRTIFEYLRARRLTAARLALERDGVSVAQAAWQAGYTSAANFATAFKREFGITPRQAVRP